MHDAFHTNTFNPAIVGMARILYVLLGENFHTMVGNFLLDSSGLSILRSVLGMLQVTLAMRRMNEVKF